MLICDIHVVITFCDTSPICNGAYKSLAPPDLGTDLIPDLNRHHLARSLHCSDHIYCGSQVLWWIYRSNHPLDHCLHIVLTMQSPLNQVWYSLVGSNWFHLCFTSMTHSLYLGSIWFSWWFVISCNYPLTYPLFHFNLLWLSPPFSNFWHMLHSQCPVSLLHHTTFHLLFHSFPVLFSSPEHMHLAYVSPTFLSLVQFLFHGFSNCFVYLFLYFALAHQRISCNLQF